MKPVYETQRRSNRRWRLPLLLLAFIVMLICGLPAVARLRHSLAGQGATAPVQAPAEVVIDPAATPPLTPIVPRDRAILIDDTAARVAPVAGLQKWEYKLLVERELRDYERELNKLGAEGWDFSGTIVLPVRQAGDGGDGSELLVQRQTTVLKRPRRAAAPAFSPDGPERTAPDQLRGRTAPAPIDSDQPFKLK